MILASIPVTFLVINYVQKKATPLHIVDMENMARAGKELEQSTEAIATVKAFTAEERQSRRFMAYIDETVMAWNKLAVIYGARMGLTATLTLVMFTSGFWYGSYLVQHNKTSPGNVLTTFWSCLLLGESISTILQLLQIIEMGKVAAASLSKLVQELPASDNTVAVDMDPTSPSSSSFASKRHREDDDAANAKASDLRFAKAHRVSHSTGKARARHRHRQHRSIVPMRKIWPAKECIGEISIHGLSFSYPSRPHDAVLQNVSMFIPSGETTFIVGGSGSGKSTISHLLLGLYDEYEGAIHIDDQDVRYLDPVWARSNIAAVEQNPIIFDMSLHDNIALGLCGKISETVEQKANHVPRLARSRVKEACRMTLLDRDIAKMPQGYDTKLGAGGINLSGGQKQRVALARAIIRNPPVLVLDEATSALDVKGRLLVGEFFRHWRQGKTTIIITHDLKQVLEGDFVYMLEQSRLVEQGYRVDLESRPKSRFAAMLASQQGKDSPQKSSSEAGRKEDLPSPTGLEWRASRALDKSFAREQDEDMRHTRASRWASDFRFGSVPVAMSPEPPSYDASKCNPHVGPARIISTRPYPNRYHMPSRIESIESLQSIAGQNARKRTSSTSCNSELVRSATVAGRPGHQRAMSSLSSISSTSTVLGLRPLRLAETQQEQAVKEMGTQKSLELASVAVSQRRPNGLQRKEWSSGELIDYTLAIEKMTDLPDNCNYGLEEAHTGRVVELAGEGENDSSPNKPRTLAMSKLLFRALKESWTTQPRHGVLLLGFVATILGSATQPAFSFILGKLLATMGREGQEREVLIFSLAVLGLAFLDGVLQFVRFTVLQYCANIWIRVLRVRIIAKVFRQDKAWFDETRNSSSALLIKIVKDGEDAKSFVSRIVGELLLFGTLISTVFVWAIIISWQLTLAGLALGPLFYVVIAAQSKLIMRYERQNKLQRERVAKRFYNMVHNVREIRSMALDEVFGDSFRDAVRWVESYGIRSAPFSGFGYGLKDACTYLAQALLYYVGAVLMLRGRLTLERMMIVANLIVFGVTYATQVIAYLPNLSKAIQALHDLASLLQMRDSSSHELLGHGQPTIQGAVSFRDVSFSYPARPETRVLDKCSFDIGVGERVALVGQSGCGKSTIAALVQRLYEPQSGVIVVDETWPLNKIDVHHLRQNLACVAQKSDLFDDTIRNNILLGNEGATPTMLDTALRQACCTDIISQLEAGVDTRVGEDASNLSGGQKQRIALARALVRADARVRILDECTSALDPENQARVAASLLDHDERDREGAAAAAAAGSSRDTYAARGPTTIVVTHKLELMKRCDRILVMEHGRVVQSGSFHILLGEKGGAFSKLARAGEWGA